MLNRPASGVGHPASHTSRPNSELVGTFGHSDPSFQSRAVGVGHPPGTIPDVRAAEARSRKRDKPEGVTHAFQVSLYKIEPNASWSARNLLSNDNWRLALLDEMEESGPQVPLVSKPFSFACRAERLARTRSRPDRAIIGPSGFSEGVGPDTDPGEEVALSVSRKFIWPYIADIPFIDMARRDVAGRNQFAQPRRGEWIDLVVVGAHSPHSAQTDLPDVRRRFRDWTPDEIIGSQYQAWCTGRCHDLDMAERASRKRHEGLIVAMMERLVKRRFPSVEIIQDKRNLTPHVYVKKDKHGFWRLGQASVSFNFPGMKIAPASYRWDRDTSYGDRKAHFECCAGDKEAFEAWARSTAGEAA